MLSRAVRAAGALALVTIFLTVGFFFGAKWSAARGARVFEASARLSVVRTGLELYYADTGRFPTEEEGIQLLTTPTARGPYVKPGAVLDPWGRVFLYEYRGTGVPAISTLGADGRPGGTNENQDLTARPAMVGLNVAPPTATNRATPAGGGDVAPEGEMR
jgi:general secretion pathway protein G